jgi:DNA-binding NarL/FixJ family response regulator
MEPQITKTAPSVPELIRDSRRLRQDLDENVARLRVTLEHSKTVAAEWPWKPGSVALSPAPPSPSQETQILDRLTKREVEVFRLIAEGKSTKQTAAILGIAFRTAVCHRYRIFQKLRVHETASLVRLAVRAGLVRP